MAFTKEQLDEMRRQVEEDYHLDMAAIERLQRRFTATSSRPAYSENAGRMAQPQQSGEDVEVGASSRPTLIGTVLSVMRANAGHSLTGRDVMVRMDQQGFEFVGDERRRLTSINIALSRLVMRGEVRVVRHGSGREPNRYRAATARVEPITSQAVNRTEAA